MSIETVKIKKIFTKQFKKFTALNILVRMDGEDEWLNGYEDDTNQNWEIGDTVEVDSWYDEDGERWRYKPAEEKSKGKKSSGNRGSSNPGAAATDGDVSNREIKSLIIRTATFLKKVAEDVEGLKKQVAALRGQLDNTSHLQEPEQQQKSGTSKSPPDHFPEEPEDDGLPF